MSIISQPLPTVWFCQKSAQTRAWETKKTPFTLSRYTWIVQAVLLSFSWHWYWIVLSAMSLTRRVLCTERTAASMPAPRTGWGTLSRQKWWSCRRTRVPTPPRWSAASTQWCFHFATYHAWTAGIFPRNPPCFRIEAPRRWNQIRRLKNRGCTGQKLNYRGPFFSVSLFCSLRPGETAAAQWRQRWAEAQHPTTRSAAN